MEGNDICLTGFEKADESSMWGLEEVYGQGIWNWNGDLGESWNEQILAGDSQISYLNLDMQC